MALGACAAPASAQTSSWWLATGLGAGAITPDQSLANYRWDTSPAPLYALQAVAGYGRLATGLRYSRWTTTQGTGLSNQVDSDPTVQLDNLALVAQFRLAQVAGFQLWATGLAGRVGVSYAPDQISFATGVGGEEITVDYAAINEMNLGWGLELKRSFGDRLAAALQAEQSGFHLDTSHRRGAEIVSAREKFVNWSLRLQVSWVVDLG
jgi:hypothetical protein